MIAVLALVSLSWLPPLGNCDASALRDLDHYLLETERIVKLGESVGADGSITDIAQRTFLAVPLPVDVLSAELSDPEVGGMIAWRLVAYDRSGYRDCESEVARP